VDATILLQRRSCAEHEVIPVRKKLRPAMRAVGGEIKLIGKRSHVRAVVVDSPQRTARVGRINDHASAAPGAPPTVPRSSEALRGATGGWDFFYLAAGKESTIGVVGW